MNTIQETPSLVVLVSIVALISVFLTLGKHKRSLVDVTLAASALSALAYMVFDSAVRGIAPLFIIGLADVFLIYVPIAFSIGLVCRLLFRRKLYVFRGAPEIE